MGQGNASFPEIAAIGSFEKKELNILAAFVGIFLIAYYSMLFGWMMI
ncbi:MAG: hypothetical protein HY717_05435 [Planctomycetes bacterium]|nr:hypothetical protein [Planctomycetota bacterium]